MILDKRILNGKKPLTCLDLEEAREFKGKVCIFSDSYVNYKNIQEYMKNPQYVGILELDNSEETEDYIFRNAHDGYKYCLALPLEWVKESEKKYRPYKDVEEFFDDVGCTLGDVIRFRKKDTTEEEYHTLLTGFKGIARVNIGLGDGGYYSLSDLFSLFELYTSGGWRPFGIEE